MDRTYTQNEGYMQEALDQVSCLSVVIYAIATNSTLMQGDRTDHIRYG